MSWLDTNSICDLPIAQRAQMSGNGAQNFLGVSAGSLSSVAVAKAACDTKVAALAVPDQCIGDQCSRGMQMASNMGASFTSSWTAFHASLPDMGDHQLRAITL